MTGLEVLELHPHLRPVPHLHLQRIHPARARALHGEGEDRRAQEEAAEAAMDDDPLTEPKVKPKTFRAALIQILIADVSMSLDNVLAVAAAPAAVAELEVSGLQQHGVR